MAIEIEEKITVLPSGVFQVEKRSKVVEDGKFMGYLADVEAYSIEVGQDVSEQSQEIQDLAKDFHTQARIEARQAQLEASDNG